MLSPELAGWILLPFLALEAGGLTVDTPSPDALCPPLEHTRQVVEARLGTLELEGTWRATYVLVHRESGDVVVLKLLDPSGRVRLERELAAKDGTCATLAQVIALMLERYFIRPEANVDGQAEAASAGDGVSAPQRPQKSEPKTSEPALKTQAQSTPMRPLPAPTEAHGSESNGSYSLDTGLWVSTAWVAPSLGFGIGVSRVWELGFAGGFDLSRHAHPISNGWGQSRRAPLVLQAKRCWHPGELRLNFGAELMELFEYAQTEGLLESGSGIRVVQGVGLRAGVEFVPRKVRPFAEVSSSLLFPGLSRRFEVDHRSVFELPSFVIGLSFGIRTTL